MLVEQLALRAALHQVLEFLLAVDLDQEFGQLAQGLHRHQLAVHVGARAAVRADHPAHDELALVLDRLRLEPARAPADSGEKLAATSARSAPWRTTSPAPRPPAISSKRIDHDGFAGAGLAGERGEAGAELELRLVDDDEIAQFKMSEHGSVGLTGVSRRCRCRGRRGPSAASSAAAGSNHSPADAAA